MTSTLPTAVCHGCGEITHGEHRGTCGECDNEREYCCRCWENGPFGACRLEYEHDHEPKEEAAT